jgi:hypothetical protein
MTSMEKVSFMATTNTFFNKHRRIVLNLARKSGKVNLTRMDTQTYLRLYLRSCCVHLIQIGFRKMQETTLNEDFVSVGTTLDEEFASIFS